MLTIAAAALAPPGFEDLYRRRANDALRYAAVIAGPAEAEDVCQEAWLRVWQHWDGSEPSRREAWALRIVRNCALQRVRWRRRRPVEPLNELDLQPTAGVEDVVLTRLRADEALGRIARLPSTQRQTFFLREIADLSYGEIAEIQQVPPGTVMSRLHAARRQIARTLPV
ncbi:MAG: RNA polymerase sigma factor [Acidimicrobiia bacterium]